MNSYGVEAENATISVAEEIYLYTPDGAVLHGELTPDAINGKQLRRIMKAGKSGEDPMSFTGYSFSSEGSLIIQRKDGCETFQQPYFLEPMYVNTIKSTAWRHDMVGSTLVFTPLMTVDQDVLVQEQLTEAQLKQLRENTDPTKEFFVLTPEDAAGAAFYTNMNNIIVCTQDGSQIPTSIVKDLSAENALSRFGYNGTLSATSSPASLRTRRRSAEARDRRRFRGRQARLQS